MKRLLCLALCLALLGCVPAFAEAPVEPVKVYLDGLLRLRGYRADGTLWLCPADVAALFGLEPSSSLDGETYRLRLPSWELTATAGSDILTADGRTLYCPEGWRVIDGKVCFPAAVSEKLFSLCLSEENGVHTVDASGFQLLRGGDNYYTTHFSPEDLFWLSRIIDAEAHWESLETQLGVGNVVLNRVHSELFPATVMGVVLDRKDAVQFEAAIPEAFAAEENASAVLAARLCLEGYNPVGESLYFVNPVTGDATWFEHALTETARLGSLVFYS